MRALLLGSARGSVVLLHLLVVLLSADRCCLAACHDCLLVLDVNLDVLVDDGCISRSPVSLQT